MLKMSDVAGRLRLLRYGLLVVVIMTFVITLTYPVIAGQGIIGVTDFLGSAILYTAVVAVICVAIYFGYSLLLKRTVSDEESSTPSSNQETTS